MAEQAGNCNNLVGSSEERLPATRPKCICNYFKITAVRAYSNVFLLPIRIGLERRPRLICALVFRAHTEVYEWYIYTRRDKTGLSYIIILFIGCGMSNFNGHLLFQVDCLSCSYLNPPGGTNFTLPVLILSLSGRRSNHSYGRFIH